MVKRLIYS